MIACECCTYEKWLYCTQNFIIFFNFIKANKYYLDNKIKITIVANGTKNNYGLYVKTFFFIIAKTRNKEWTLLKILRIVDIVN